VRVHVGTPTAEDLDSAEQMLRVSVGGNSTLACSSTPQANRA